MKNQTSDMTFEQFQSAVSECADQIAAVGHGQNHHILLAVLSEVIADVTADLFDCDVAGEQMQDALIAVHRRLQGLDESFQPEGGYVQ
jgi:hypothetical protein